MKFKFLFSLALVLFMFSFSLGFASEGSCSVSYNFGERASDTNLGGDVTRLQNFLVSNEYLLEGNITGYFGPLTLEAVKKFQAANGISPVAGYVGTLTRSKIKEIGCGKSEVLGVTTDLSARLVCTQEVKLCPDGSYVGRDSNNRCEFKRCPTSTPTPSLGVSARIGVDKTEYKPGDTVQIAYNVRNAGSAPVTYTFPTGCAVTVSGPFEDSTACTAAISTVTIPSAGTHKFAINRKISSTAKTKIHTATVTVVGRPELSVSVDVNVKAPVQSVTAHIGVDKTEYKPGDTVQIAYNVRNAGSAPVTYTFPTGCAVTVSGPFEDSTACTAAISTVTIPSAGTHKFAINRKISSTAKTKIHTATVTVVGRPELSVSVDVNVKAPVASSTTKSSIKVLSPNGGERWIGGNDYSVLLETGNIKGGTVEIELTAFKSSGTLYGSIDRFLNVIKISSVKVTKKAVKIHVPFFMTPGKYKIKASVCDKDNCDIQDLSDNLIEIVAPHSTKKAPLTISSVLYEKKSTGNNLIINGVGMKSSNTRVDFLDTNNQPMVTVGGGVPLVSSDGKTLTWLNFTRSDNSEYNKIRISTPEEVSNVLSFPALK